MASTVDTYGQFSANSIEVDSVIKFTGSTDDTKSISIQLSGNPTAAGDVVYTLPVITSGKTLATTDDVTSLPSSTANQILVSNAGTYESASVSGDLSNTLGAFTIANGAVSTAKIAADAVDGTKIADDAIDSEHIADGAVDAAHLASNSVSTAKIAANAVTTGKINDGAVSTAKIAADAVDGTKIADDAIDSEHIADGAIDTAHIADANVTLAKLEAVTDGNIIVGNASNRPAAVAVSGDISLSNAGVAAIAAGVIVDADVNASAAIAGSKISPNFGAQTVQTTGDFQTAATKALRFGADVNGTWRIVIQSGGGALLFQKKESGAWVTKSSVAS